MVETPAGARELPLLEEIESLLSKGSVVVFLLGCVDVGKTFLATTLANIFCARGYGVAVVDADVGQSDIGPPCSIGVGVLERPVKILSEAKLAAIFFIGSTSPQRCEQECLRNVAAAVERAKGLARLVIVDSTGWVQGEDAKRFKLSEIKCVAPDIIAAIQRGEELEPILKDFRKNEGGAERAKPRIIRLKSPPEAKAKSRENRALFREEAYNKYFSNSKTRIFDLSILGWLSRRGTILGLFRQDECVGLGILERLNFERGIVEVFTPVNGDVDWIKPGSIRLVNLGGRIKEYRSKTVRANQNVKTC
ncbi:MAG: Polynucleotide 5'-kinase [Candidatus Alkanophagales archaeon MCA70_species_2]|nr:Polynucleotide 5'-kinase [Candidatus Alkanophaga liquidiphilum]